MEKPVPVPAEWGLRPILFFFNSPVLCDRIYLVSLLYRGLYRGSDKTASYISGIPGPGGIRLKVDDKVIIAGIAIVAALAIIAIIGAACCACVFCVGTTSWNWGNWGGYSTQTEHKAVTDTAAAADNIELYVDTIGGDVEIVLSPTVTTVAVNYDVYAPVGRLDNMVTRTTSINVDNNTTQITAKAERKPGIITGNYGAGITVTVPKNSSCHISTSTPWAAPSQCHPCTAMPCTWTPWAASSTSMGAATISST
jgi:hypothetical protein